MPLSFSESHMLSHLEERLRFLNEEDKAIKERAQKNIESSSIILGILAVFQFSGNLPRNIPLLSLIFIVYAVIVFLSAYVMTTRRWQLPIDITYESVRQASRRSESDYYLWMLISYTSVVRENMRTMRLKHRIVQFSIWLVAADIAIILLMVAAV